MLFFVFQNMMKMVTVILIKLSILIINMMMLEIKYMRVMSVLKMVNWPTANSYTREYDADGNRISESYMKDDNGDGIVDEVWSKTYDANGFELSSSGTNSSTNLNETYYEYDEDGNLIYEGDEDYFTTYEYDEDGNLSEMTQNGSWGVDSSVFYTYDENGNLVSEGTDWDGDGMVDSSLRLHL